ncbi:MAG: hypothetical protein IJB86_02925 [Clostridia bacterium]|nr:hypothetical protein [Clostridia bacterium]
MPNKNDIYQMDCSAVVYPYIATKDVNQSFTMEADLDTDIDPVRLKAAAQSLCERFPTMFVKLHTDSKGYALEHVHDVTPFVMERPDVLNQPFDLSQNNDHLVRITYKKNRVAVEVFHSVSDGSGGIALLKSIIAEYYRSMGEEVSATHGVLLKEDPVKATETEDSFRTNCDVKRKNASRAGKKAQQYYHDGPFDTWHQTELSMSVDELKALSKKNGATITEYLASLYLYTFYRFFKNEKMNKPITLSVPINLRPMFNSETLRNFSLYFFATVPKMKGEVTFDDILQKVKKDFVAGMDKDLILDTIKTNVTQNDMAVFVKAPRCIKQAILRFGNGIYGEGLFTSTLSNLGLVKFPEELVPHVRMFRAILGPSPKNNIKMTAYCYGKTFAMMVASSLKSREIENDLKTLLEEQGVTVTMKDHSDNW